MSKFTLKAEPREWTGKERAKKVRREGIFPAIVYGPGAEPSSIQLSVREMEAVLSRIHGEKVLVSLEHGGKTEQVFIRNIQRDPVKSKLLHADFYRVDMAMELDTKIPVIGLGTPQGVKMGGLLEQVVRILDVRCLPSKVPPHIDVKLDSLEIGQSIHVRD
ncbi:MAG: 50S ribosomal protein L25, partial [Candidatus Sumerlaeia bacterium]|nr:50S ribosomal protein L25 [Candidatus Sumerlaeia bacterium]